MTAMQAIRPSLMPVTQNPTDEQRKWLNFGLQQPGGKLPLHDDKGVRIDSALITACMKAGWAEPWAINPLRQDNQICRLTEAGRTALQRAGVIRVDFSLWRRDSGDAGSASRLSLIESVSSR